MQTAQPIGSRLQRCRSKGEDAELSEEEEEREKAKGAKKEVIYFEIYLLKDILLLFCGMWRHRRDN